MAPAQPTLLPKGTFIDNYEIVDTLGTGGYGQVYLGRHLKDPSKQIAIKSLQHSMMDERQKSFLRTEISLHARLSGHGHIVKLDRIVRECDWTHVMLECGLEGDLFEAITERNMYAGNHSLIRKVFLQLLDAVSYCHAKGVYHRDIKPENILIFDGGRTIKLADFGLATTDTISKDYGCGSTFYFSPECQGELARDSTRVGYATASNDVWALGVILINLATGRNAWRLASLKDDSFRAYLSDPDFLLKILPISRELSRILKRILCVDPMRRICLDELRERIERCKFFTRTAEVDAYEKQQDKEATMRRMRLFGTLQPKKHSPTTTLPPSPPSTPCAYRLRYIYLSM
ncbi:kinase-like domain-containing protein [Spinellus fusiger]|nr:kinase-like domain-containing protein [Spinellus fusiger]